MINNILSQEEIMIDGVKKMAKRPVFCVKSEPPYYEVVDIDFLFYSGFSVSQKQKSIGSLHEAFLNKYPRKRIIEISSKSTESVGNRLSAFNLKLNTPIGERNIENVFQAGKVFENGGPYKELLDITPSEAKKDERLRNSGDLISFDYFGEKIPLNPKDYYYNWIYSKALYDSMNEYVNIFDYDAFTDIEFNPNKSINCQARTVAIFVGLYRQGLLDRAMQSKENYCEIVYGCTSDEKYTQLSLF